MTPADGAVVEATKAAPPPFKPLPMHGPDVEVERRDDGSVVIRSRHAPGAGPRSIAHLLKDRAEAHPERALLRQREPGHGPWRTVTYGEALRAAEGIAQWLLDRGLTAKDSVMVLSGNSLEHGLIMLGCYTAGVPIAPTSAKSPTPGCTCTQSPAGIAHERPRCPLPVTGTLKPTRAPM